MAGDGWGHRLHRPVDVARGLLEALESPADDEHSCPGHPVETLLPITTGLDGLDRFLGGGLRRGAVTVVEADDPFTADALATTIARRAEGNCLLDHENVVVATGWVLAAEADVSVAGLVTGRGVTGDELADVHAVVPLLEETSYLFSSSLDRTGLVDQIMRVGPAVDVVVVAGAERFGAVDQTADELLVSALADDIAVLLVVRSDDRPGPADPSVVVATAGSVAGTVRLVRTDDIELLVTCELDVDLITGDVTDRRAVSP